MRTLAAVHAARLADVAEQSLKTLGYSYITNKASTLVEYEVRSPCHFLVTIEDLTRRQWGYPFRSGVKVESAIEVKPLVGAPESVDVSRKYAADFIALLRKSFPKEGDGGRLRSHSDRGWESLAEFGSGT